MKIGEFAQRALEHSTGNILQVSGASIMAFGYDFSIDTIGVFLGVFIAFIGLMISWRSLILQKKVHLRELEVKDREILNLKMEERLLESQLREQNKDQEDVSESE